MKTWQKIACVLVALLVVMPASAQYYSGGVSPAGTHWRALRGERVEVVAPDYAEPMARRLIHYMDSLSGSICYGLEAIHPEPLAMPVVLHGANGASNGITIMAPRRIEMCATPSTGNYATTWLRQLSLHEYRHAAQYGALFSGKFSRVLSYILGEQALLANTGVMPFWWLEGDAVDAETQASIYGRALQPSFTMHYRAVGREMLEGGNPDIWFSGSYNRYTPSHYELGYQMVTTANTLAGRYAWGEIMDYAARKPYTITPFEWAMRRKWGTSTLELFRTTFDRLNTHWESLGERTDNATRLAIRVGRGRPMEVDDYESWRYPMWLSDTHFVALRSSFDRSDELVVVDSKSGLSRTLRKVGYIHTRPTIIGDYVYWCELTQLSSAGQDLGSLLYRTRTDGTGRRERLLERRTNPLYPTNFEGELAYIRYNPEGTYTVVWPEGELTLPEEVECHGMAATEGALYILTTAYGGMAIERIDPATATRTTIKAPSHVTLSDLTADSVGNLYFGSIASGYDEIHRLNLHTLREERLTTSRYGSFYGSASPSGDRLALAIYDAEGYHPALLNLSEGGVEEVAYSPTPRNVVNPEVYKWDWAVCIDSLTFTAAEQEHSERAYKARRYSPLGHALNIHSWAPIYYRPDQLMAGSLSSVRFGATISSQSLLSDAVTTAGLYLLPSGAVGSLVNFKYIGLPVKIELSAEASNSSPAAIGLQSVLMRAGNYNTSYDHTESCPTPPAVGHSYNLYGRLHLPFVLSHSNVTTTLTPAVELGHSNTLLYSPYSESFSEGRTAIAATLQWNSYTRSAYRNLQPRWGISMAVGVGKLLAPSLPSTTLTLGAFGRIYTPAFGANDGLTICASYQDIAGSGPLSYTLDFGWNIPRGLRTTVYPDDRIGLSVQYDTPLLYPDLGISGIVLLKRLRLSVMSDNLWGRLWIKGSERIWRGAHCVGADLWADTAWLRLPDQADLSFKLGLYFDMAEPQHPTITGGVNVNF